jgi:hypothetical protein
MKDIGENRADGEAKPVGLWSQAVDGAETESELVSIVREYTATWGPDELSRLPAACRPGKISDGEDVSELAFRLAQAHLAFTGSLSDRLLLERLMGFFTHASARFATLQATASSSSS